MDVCSYCSGPMKPGSGCTICSGPVVNDPLLGRTFAGRYELVELIGRGGMSRVYRAKQIALTRTVAVKVLHEHLSVRASFQRRFELEARAVALLDHPSCVRILDYGQDDGQLYLVLEHIEGGSLADALRTRGRLPAAEALPLICQVLGALGEAHEHGIVHRDVKPANVMLTVGLAGAPAAKLVDFGLARAAAETTSITAPGTMVGTPRYMAPEQFFEATVDGRTDVYAVGVLLFELLVGHPPFAASSVPGFARVHSVASRADVLRAAVAAGMSEALAAAVVRALAVRASERFQSALDMEQALADAYGYEAPGVALAHCRGCGVSKPSQARFCTRCGARDTAPSVMKSSERGEAGAFEAGASGAAPAAECELRHEEVTSLLGSIPGPQVHWAHVSGAAGYGKTHILDRATRRARARGVTVIRGRVHPLRLPVPYYLAHRLIAEAHGVSEAELRDLLEGGHSFGNALIQAGVSGAARGSGVHGIRWRSRASAVAAALASALRRCARKREAPYTLLLVDDWQTCDPLSRRVLMRVARGELGVPVRLVTADRQDVRQAHTNLHLAPLTGIEVERFARAAFIGDVLPALSERAGETQCAPFCLELLGRLGASERGAIVARRSLPSLADLVERCIGRLPWEQRRALVSAAVAGDRGLLSGLVGIRSPDRRAAISGLGRSGWLRLEGDHFEFAQRLTRDVALAMTPVALRLRMHARMAEKTEHEGDDIAVRAHHAAEANHSSAPILLELAGDVAAQGGDAESAAAAYQRAISQARRFPHEVDSSGQPVAEHLLSGKLARALARSGDSETAELVLRDALARLQPNDVSSIPLLCALARILGARGENAAAAALLARGDRAAQTPLDTARMLAVRASITADPAEEARLRRSAADALDSADAPIFETVGLWLELAEQYIAMERIEEARESLRRAKDLCVGHDVPALSSKVFGLLGVVAQRRGALPQASGLFRRAARLAAEGGDAEQHFVWSRADGD